MPRLLTISYCLAVSLAVVASRAYEQSNRGENSPSFSFVSAPPTPRGHDVSARRPRQSVSPDTPSWREPLRAYIDLLRMSMMARRQSQIKLARDGAGRWLTVTDNDGDGPSARSEHPSVWWRHRFGRLPTPWQKPVFRQRTRSGARSPTSGKRTLSLSKAAVDRPYLPSQRKE